MLIKRLMNLKKAFYHQYLDKFKNKVEIKLLGSFLMVKSELNGLKISIHASILIRGLLLFQENNYLFNQILGLLLKLII